MLERYLFFLLSFTCTTLWAQSPFSIDLTISDPLTDLSIFSSEPLGGGMYRLSGNIYHYPTNENEIWMVDVDENGIQSNGVAYHFNGEQPVMNREFSEAGSYLFRWTEDTTLHFLKTNAMGNAEWVRRIPLSLGMNFTSVYPLTVEKNDALLTLGRGITIPSAPNMGYSLLFAASDTNDITTFIRFLDADYWAEFPIHLIPLSTDGMITSCKRRPANSSAYRNFVIQRWDSSLNNVWSDTYGFSAFNYLDYLGELNDGGLLATGLFKDAFSGPLNNFRMKLDSAGNVVWCWLSTHTTDYIHWGDMYEDGDGNIVLTGTQNGPITVLMDSTGQVLSALHYPTLPTDVEMKDIRFDSTSQGFLISAENYGTSEKAFFLRLDSSLNDACGAVPINWSDTVFMPTITNVPVVLNYDSVMSNDTTLSSSPYSPFPAMDLCLSTSIEDDPFPPSLVFWPNPVREILNTTTSNVPYSIFSVRGKLLQHGVVRSGGIRVAELPEGLYFIQLGTRYTRRTVHFIKSDDQ